MDPKLSIIIPTYNEHENIKKTIINIDYILKRTTILFEIVVVDDNSPDGTAQIVKELIIEKYPVRLVERHLDPGLSQSVVEGFKQARGNILLVTDCDESHDYSKIPEMYKLCKDNDIVIGSRYALGGKIINWPIERRIISLGATFLSKVLFPHVTDPVSGFFAVQKSLVNNAPLKPRGYKILLEILGKSYWRSFVEIPYEFKNRKSGNSKLRAGTIIDFLYQVIDIARFPGRSFEEIQKMKRFLIVGATGVFTNTIILAILKESGIPLVGAAFLSTECAILGNFILNDNWTFKKEKNAKPWLHRLITFNGISAGGLLITITVLVMLTTIGLNYLISNFLGIVVAFLFNFLMNRKITWVVDNSSKI
jgi:dolichol-phosphate mannosyltransferase